MFACLEFESDVIPDSGKTDTDFVRLDNSFESDVIPDSGKTSKYKNMNMSLFESDVIPDSGKTKTEGTKDGNSV